MTRYVRFLSTVALLVSCWLSLNSEIQAQRQPLEFQVDEGRWVFRTGAPLQLRLTSICSASAPISGDLEIRVEDGGGSLVGSILLPEQVYSPGRQEVEYLLPLQSHTMYGSIDFQFHFVEKSLGSGKPTGNTYSSQGTLIPPRMRSFAMPVVCASQHVERPQDDYEWLTLEHYCPGQGDNAGQTPMVTMHPRLPTADLPRDPLKYLAYDVVVLESTGFAELGRAQLQALETWILGGGSLFLRLGREWPTDQAEFLKRLLSKSPDLLADDVEGTDLIPIIRDGSYKTLPYGFGQVCLSTDRSWSRVSEQDRHTLLADFWRLNQTQRSSILTTKQLSLLPMMQESNQQYNNYQLPPSVGQFPESAAYNQFYLNQWGQFLNRPQSRRPGTAIDALLPRDVRTVPVALLLMFAFGYVIYIGFGEYFLLGKIQRRRWTWFSFPVMTLALTLLTMGTAKGYLSSEIELNRVILRDVTDAGVICREQTLDLHFQGTTKNVTHSLESQIFTPVANQPISYRGGNYVPPQSIDTDVLTFVGNPTGKATAIQTVQQWKPQLNRTVSFPRQVSLSPAYLQLDLKNLFSNLPGATQQIRQAIPQAEFFGIYTHAGFGQLTFLKGTDQARDYTVLEVCRNQLAADNVPTGLMTLFDKISPSADTGLFDLICAPNETFSFLGVRENGALIVYRWKNESGH